MDSTAPTTRGRTPRPPQNGSGEETPRPDPRGPVASRPATTTLTRKSRPSGGSDSRRADQAAATLKRAWEIAARDMFKEAILLWEHAARLNPEVRLPPETLLTWQINAQQYHKAIQFFTANEPALRYGHPRLWATARELFAVLSLTAAPETLQVPPWNAPPWHHGETARNALIACCRGEQRALGAYLAPIGPDSPFRPFRRILESLATPVGESNRITELLQGIPDDSPFAPLAAIARVRILPPLELAATLLAMPPASRIPAATLRGVEEKQLKLLLKIGEAKNPGQQLTLLLAHADSLPREATRTACLNLLPEFMEERSRFEKRFGPLGEFERERIFALHHERLNSLTRALGYWRKCILLIEGQPENAENRLRLALLYRHLVAIEQRFAAPSTSQILQNLEKSLDFDPEARDVWLELLQWRGRLRRERHLLHQLADRAARRFPDDPQILTFALEAATEKKAFKKAAALARRIQKRSPERAELRDIGLTSRLSHARKLIASGRFELARAELERAGRLPGVPAHPVCLMQAMLAFIDGHPEQGDAHLEEGRDKADRKVIYAVHALLEAATLKLPPLILDRFRRALIQCDAAAPDREEVIAIAALVTEAHPRHPATALEIMALLSGHFRKAAVLVYTLDEMHAVCHALALTRRHLLLALYGKIAETRWPREAVFVYYRALGQCEGHAWRLSDQDFHLLLQAADDLKEKDPEIAEQINALLAIPPSQRPTDPWHSVPLSPARIPKPLESKLLRELRSRLQEEFQASQDEAASGSFRKRLIDSLTPTEFGQRGPLVLGYLIDRAFRLRRPADKGRPHPPPATSHQQLEMDLFHE